MKLYRLVFGEPNGNTFANVDVSAESVDEAFAMAYKMPESRKYSQVSCMEVPDGPTNIGLEVLYTDTYLKKDFHGFIIIHTESEEDARAYYDTHLKGGRFWHNIGETADDGKCVRGKILSTYYATCPGYDFDATTE